MLRFKAEPAMFRKRISVEPVGCVELHAGFRREALHESPRLLVSDSGGDAQRAEFTVDDVVVVVPASRFVKLFDAFANQMRIKKVERCVFDRGNFAGGDQRLVRNGVVRREDLQLVI